MTAGVVAQLRPVRKKTWKGREGMKSIWRSMQENMQDRKHIPMPMVHAFMLYTFSFTQAELNHWHLLVKYATAMRVVKENIVRINTLRN